MNRKLICGMVFLGVLGSRLWAAERPREKFEIYSWKSGNDWDFSVIPAAQNTSKAAIEIKQSGGPLRGTSKVKEKLLSMKEGDSISWQERASSGLVYPPELVIEDIHAYAQSVGVKLNRPPSVP